MLPRTHPHPCVTETFGKRTVTVSLVTGDVYTADSGRVPAWRRMMAGLWVWRILNENGFPTRLRHALHAVG